MGAAAFTLIEKYKKDLPKEGVVLEIGSSRGENSSEYLFDFCNKNEYEFYTVDMDPVQYERCKNKGMNSYNMTGEHFLINVFSTLNKKISFCYLDNFDFIYDHIVGANFVKDQINRYSSLGLEMNNINSQKAHFDQTVECLKYLNPSGFILFDDTFIKNGKFDGKGGSAVPYLLNNGFSIIEKNTDNAPEYESFVLLRKNHE